MNLNVVPNKSTIVIVPVKSHSMEGGASESMPPHIVNTVTIVTTV